MNPLNYLLRNIPRTLWSECKDRAREECCSLRELILRALSKYLDAR